MRSKIDPSLKLDSDYSVVSIVKHGEHAIFLIEDMIEEEYSLRKVHFIPEIGGYCVLYGGNLEQLIGNKTVAGLVENQSLAMNKAITLCSREEIFTKLKLTKYIGISFVISRSVLQPMLTKINDEKRGSAFSPRFNIKGKMEEWEAGHNCCTWVLDRAALAGIDVRQYLQTGTVAYWLRLPDLPSQVTLGLINGLGRFTKNVDHTSAAMQPVKKISASTSSMYGNPISQDLSHIKKGQTKSVPKKIFTPSLETKINTLFSHGYRFKVTDINRAELMIELDNMEQLNNKQDLLSSAGEELGILVSQFDQTNTSIVRNRPTFWWIQNAENPNVIKKIKEELESKNGCMVS